MRSLCSGCGSLGAEALNCSPCRSPGEGGGADTATDLTISLAVLDPLVDQNTAFGTNSKAMLAGSISSMGKQYVIGLKAISCKSGESLAQEQVQATAKEEVLTVLGNAATSLRTKLGESLPTVQKYDTPLAQATTPSLEALKAFSEAQTQYDFTAALALYKRAIELDPNFARAYAGMGFAYNYRGESDLARENLHRAFELRDHASEREKYFISAQYYKWATGELEKANQVFEQWARAYPRDNTPLWNLTANYLMLGQYEKVRTELVQLNLLDPGSSTGGDYMSFLVILDRPDEAKTVYNQAVTSNRVESETDLNLHVSRYLVAFLEDDRVEMERQVVWAKGKAGVEDVLLTLHSDTQAYMGRLRKARELSRQAADTAKRNGQTETAASWLLNAAMREAEVGNPAQARQEAKMALSLASSRDLQTFAAVTLARVGDTARAQTIADDLHKRYPLHTLLNEYWLPAIRAAIELNRNDPAKAVALLQRTSAYELGAPSFISLPLYPVYVRGEAYLKLGHGPQAAAEFQKVIDHRSIVANVMLGALSQLQLGRAKAMSGDNDGARKAYQDFLNLWKDADPDIPIFKQAKTEYAKLQ